MPETLLEVVDRLAEEGQWDQETQVAILRGTLLTLIEQQKPFYEAAYFFYCMPPCPEREELNEEEMQLIGWLVDHFFRNRSHEEFDANWDRIEALLKRLGHIPLTMYD
jgi:hypothetical protein